MQGQNSMQRPILRRFNTSRALAVITIKKVYTSQIKTHTQKIANYCTVVTTYYIVYNQWCLQGCLGFLEN